MLERSWLLILHFSVRTNLMHLTFGGDARSLIWKKNLKPRSFNNAPVTVYLRLNFHSQSVAFVNLTPHKKTITFLVLSEVLLLRKARNVWGFDPPLLSWQTCWPKSARHSQVFEEEGRLAPTNEAYRALFTLFYVVDPWRCTYRKLYRPCNTWVK